MANKFDHLTATERASAPTTPDTSDWRLYFKSDGLYVVDDAGNETGPLGTGGGGASAFRGARVYRSTTQSIPTGTPTAISFDAESFDTNTLHDTGTNPSRVLLDQIGYWRVIGEAQFAANGTGDRRLRIHLNGTLHTQALLPGHASLGVYPTVGDIVYASAVTDYVELAVYQDSGGALNIQGNSVYTFLAVEYLGT